MDSSPPESGPPTEQERSWLRRQAQKCVRGPLRNSLDASDLTQETLLAAERGKAGKTFAGRGALRAWLRAILRNVAAQQARRRGFGVVHEELSSSVPGVLTASKFDREGDGSHEEVQRRLKHLSERDREVVLLRVSESLPFAEIGQRLNMSESNARVIFNRVVKDLRGRGNSGSGS